MTSIPRGRFCWYELMTTDPGAADDFYAAVAGWGTEEWQGSDPPYTLWKNGPTALGGLMELPGEAAAAGVPPHWIAYVSTPDFDASLQEARATGAELVWGPRSLPGVGRFAGMRDPQGAMFALYEPAGEAPGHDGVAGPGEFSWHELATSDWEQAWRFYAALFDWQKGEAMDMGEMGTYQIFNRGAHPVGAMFDKPPQIPVPNWLLYVRVPDMDAAMEAVRNGGGQVLHGPMDVPGGDSITQCLDPQGAAFALHHVAS